MVTDPSGFPIGGLNGGFRRQTFFLPSCTQTKTVFVFVFIVFFFFFALTATVTILPTFGHLEPELMAPRATSAPTASELAHTAKTTSSRFMNSPYLELHVSL